MSGPSPQGAGRVPSPARARPEGLRKSPCGSTSPAVAFRHPGPPALRPTGTSLGTRRCHRCQGRESRRWPWPSASRPPGHTAGRGCHWGAPRRPRHLRPPFPRGASPRPRQARPEPPPPARAPTGEIQSHPQARPPWRRPVPGRSGPSRAPRAAPHSLTMLRTAPSPGPNSAARAAARPDHSAPRTAPAQPIARKHHPFCRISQSAHRNATSAG